MRFSVLLLRTSCEQSLDETDRSRCCDDDIIATPSVNHYGHKPIVPKRQAMNTATGLE